MNPYEIIEKYYVKDSAIYRILKTHSEQVAQKAISVLQNHPELEVDRQFVFEAAMLHDIGINLCNAPGIHCFGTHKYIEHGYLGADLLRTNGFPLHALVCERHTGTGLSLSVIIENDLPLPHRDLMPVSLEEQIICYADKFYSKSHPEKELPLDKVRSGLMKHGAEHVSRFDAWHKLFG